ncbi:hypothetical protein IJH72_01125 [Candidatus Saccharibacteria bacterium]|nr:hypothetical protein [Candidatus Saccharibacteria bacterium]
MDFKMVKFEDVVFEERVRDFFGMCVIIGLLFPENPNFDILGKIWASVKKPIADSEGLGVSVTGLFRMEPLHRIQTHLKDRYDSILVTPEGFNPDDKIIYSSFYLNCADKIGEDLIRYNVQFKDTFYLQMLIFKETLHKFLDDPDDGYRAYCDYVNSCETVDGIDKAVCEEILNRFLAKQGLRTEETEAAERAKKEALKNGTKNQRQRQRQRRNNRDRPKKNDL